MLQARIKRTPINFHFWSIRFHYRHKYFLSSAIQKFRKTSAAIRLSSMKCCCACMHASMTARVCVLTILSYVFNKCVSPCLHAYVYVLIVRPSLSVYHTNAFTHSFPHYIKTMYIIIFLFSYFFFRSSLSDNNARTTQQTHKQNGKKMCYRNHFYGNRTTTHAWI